MRAQLVRQNEQNLSISPLQMPNRRIAGSRSMVRRDSPVFTTRRDRSTKPPRNNYDEPLSPIRNIQLSDSSDSSDSDDKDTESIGDSAGLLMGIVAGNNVVPTTASELVFGTTKDDYGPASWLQRQPKALDIPENLRRGSLRRGAF
jgi:hypothetical protein